VLINAQGQPITPTAPFWRPGAAASSCDQRPRHRAGRADRRAGGFATPSFLPVGDFELVARSLVRPTARPAGASRFDADIAFAAGARTGRVEGVLDSLGAAPIEGASVIAPGASAGRRSRITGADGRFASRRRLGRFSLTVRDAQVPRWAGGAGEITSHDQALLRGRRRIGARRSG
jgi:hypothetical protein